MRVIRHDLRITDYQTLTLPNNGTILSIAQSRRSPHDSIDMWSLDYEKGDPVVRGIYAVGTGHPFPESVKENDEEGWAFFIGTVVLPSLLVFHFFEGPLK